MNTDGHRWNSRASRPCHGSIGAHRCESVALVAQQGIEELKAEYEAKQKKAVAAGEAAARSGGDPVEAIKKALGLAA